MNRLFPLNSYSRLPFARGGRIAAIAALALLSLATPQATAQEAEAGGQDGFNIGMGADLVSRFVWRGMDCASGVCIQPALTFNFGPNLEFGAWANSSLHNLNIHELDLHLTYRLGGLSATLNDYFWANNANLASYGHYTRYHYGELALSYNFGESLPLTVSWSTIFTGGKDGEYDENGDRMYSTYINLAYALDVKGVSLTPSVGINPWKSKFTIADDKDFCLMDITLTAKKSFKVTETWTLPVFLQAVIATERDNFYLVAGLNF